MLEVKYILLLTIIFECITLCARFLFKLSSKHVYIGIMKRYHLKHFIHVHHSITGLLIFLIGIYAPYTLLITVGLALVFSDAIHHIFVLNYVVGNPEFHIVYRNVKAFEKEQKLEKRKMNQFMKHFFHHV